MKKFYITAIVLVLAAMLTACGGNTDTEPTVPTTPTVPDTPPAPEPIVDDSSDDMADTQNEAPVEGNANVLDKSTTALGEGTQAELGSKVAEVACDPDARKITFTIDNVGLKTWSLDQNAGFTDTELKNVKIFINGYEANRGSPQYHPDTGDVMFGPNELFSDNCGGVTEIAPGESVSCTLSPIKLNRGTGSNDLRAVNEIWIDSPSVDDYIEFTC